MTQTFQRDRVTWLAYLLLAVYSYFLDVLGPITPFLRQELHLSYTASSLHFTAFAAGVLLVAVAARPVVRRFGRDRALWAGAFGLSLGAVVLLAARWVQLTVAAAFVMGLVGSLILATVPSLLADRHGDLRAVAYSEANLIASLSAMAAPLVVGWTARLPGGWRWALGLAAAAPLVMFPWLRRAGGPPVMLEPVDPQGQHRSLPATYWLFWSALFLGISVEFCMIFWSADYLVAVLSMAKADAALSVSLFLGGMVVGRFAASRLVRRFSSQVILGTSVAVAGAGFGLFWSAHGVAVTLAGLALTGVGIASFYPLLLALAVGVANDSVLASARATLASGAAIIALPLLLGRLADSVGIRPAYATVAVLLAGILLIVLLSWRVPPA